MGGTRNVALARSTAIARARTEISRTLTVQVEAMIKDYQSTTTGGAEFGAAANDEQHITDVSRQITDHSLAGTELVDSWISERGTFYALVALDAERFKDAISQMRQLSEGVRPAAIEDREDPDLLPHPMAVGDLHPLGPREAGLLADVLARVFAVVALGLAPGAAHPEARADVIHRSQGGLELGTDRHHRPLPRALEGLPLADADDVSIGGVPRIVSGEEAVGDRGRGGAREEQEEDRRAPPIHVGPHSTRETRTMCVAPPLSYDWPYFAAKASSVIVNKMMNSINATTAGMKVQQKRR